MADRLAASRGADRHLIEAEPDAAPIYRQMGARDVGLAPSASIAGMDAAEVGQTLVVDILSERFTFCVLALREILQRHVG